MKLLTATDVQKEKQRQTETVALRMALLNEQVATKTKNLNLVEQAYRDRVSALEADWLQFNEQQQKKKYELLQDVLKLECRRRTALEPIKEQEVAVKRLLVAQKVKHDELVYQEIQLEKTRNRLGRLSDKVERREESLVEKERAVDTRFLHITTREQAVLSSEQKFNVQLLKWQKEYQEKTAIQLDKENILTAGMAWVSRREEALKTERVELERFKVGLQETEARLARNAKLLKL